MNELKRINEVLTEMEVSLEVHKKIFKKCDKINPISDECRNLAGKMWNDRNLIKELKSERKKLIKIMAKERVKELKNETVKD